MSTTELSNKLEYWEHQLLDLGKRNRMINYRERGRSALRLTEPAPEELYTRLARSEETLTFRRPVDRETDVRVYSILSLLETLSAPLPVLIGDIGAEGSLMERQRTLRNLRAKARLAREEQGINILYLSFGFIEWKEGKGAAAQWIKSPLILMPAVLSLDALNAPYTLKKHEDDIVLNPTLEYYLKTEYGIQLPPFDPDTETPEDYFLKLEDTADKRGWRILRQVSLGLLSFAKISMYHDLLRNRQRIEENPVIRAMAGDPEAVNQIPPQLQDLYPDAISPRDSYQVMSADSSQQDAILYSRHGVSFVMQGPPGTGKSQTITNIIAEALAAGKKVLFVSEKMAALQVVYRRLQEANLGDFCLPLHSHKANKKEVLRQIGANLKLEKQRVRDTALQSLEELSAIREELNRYARELHTLNPQLGFSCYEIYGKLEAVRDAATVIFSCGDALQVSQGQLQTWLAAVEGYAQALQRLDRRIRENPWQGFSTHDTSYECNQQLQTRLSAMIQSLSQATALLETVTQAPELSARLTFPDLPDFTEALQAVCHLGQIPDHWLRDFDFTGAESLAEEARNLSGRLSDLQAEIGQVFTPAIHGYDYNRWLTALTAEAESLVPLPLLPGRNGASFVQEAGFLKQQLQFLHAALSDACGGMAAANALLGTSFPVSGYSLSLLQSLSGLMAQNATLERSWFSGDLQALRNLAAETRRLTQTHLELKTGLLATWEPELLSIDPAPMLLRYKTDYTGAFKLLRIQYHRDRRQLQALSRVLLRELPDTLAVSALQQLKDYRDTLSRLEAQRPRLEAAFGSYYQGTDTDWAALDTALTVCEKLRRFPAGDVTGKLLALLATPYSAQEEQLRQLLPELEAAFARGEQAVTALGAALDLSAPLFDGHKTLADIDGYLTKLNRLSARTAALEPYLVAATPFDRICSAIGQLNRYTETLALFTALSPLYTATFGQLFQDEQTVWTPILSLLRETRQLKSHRLFPLLTPLVNLPEDNRQQLLSLTGQLTDLYGQGQPHLTELSRHFAPETCLTGLSLSALLTKLTGCLRCIHHQPRWVDYLEAKEACGELGLGDFITAVETADLTEDLTRSFLKGFYHLWLGAVCDRLSAVRRFRRNTQEQRIEKFTELDDLQLQIAQMRIRETLIDGLPASHRLLRATDEVSVLERELAKRRNHMPLRKLFSMIPNLLMKLKPCLMMSPLSVSYFLETEAYHFDLVIFDEASQIFPEDAIGAIFRGAQVIIAGDSKQLPPTNFFAATAGSGDGDYDGEDSAEAPVADSILEEAAAVLPNRTLRWHYRSKHEELIAFSNYQIYESGLITFPGSCQSAPDMGVEYIYLPDGVYDRSGRKNNVREAEECVRLVFEHIDKYPDRSLGIIAFSESQQTTIDTAITDYLERHPRYEWFFDENRDEPFFIKNLENVQGDERDTILFSICYGKDKRGQFYMNFGPLGLSGGERRLNVAVTRAKCNIKLIGSILPSEIDLNRARSEGARMLRAYIEYARKGASLLRPATGSAATEDPFREVVARFLEEHGYRVHRGVGCSDYKLDIGVEDPEHPGDFLAGIQCDGPAYAQSKTARDRDHLRLTVLRNMGWTLYRVWSTQWVRNPDEEAQALLAFLAGLQAPAGEKPKPTEETAAPLLTEPDTVAATSEENPYGFAYYEEADWEAAPGRHRWDIDAQLLYVVGVEQPIHLDLLYRRLAPALRCSKVTDDLRLTVDHTLRQNSEKVTVDSDRFVRLLPLTPVTVRIPRPGDAKRPMEQIHTQEVAQAMLQIVRSSFGLTEEALLSECAVVFGYERLGPNIRAKTEAALAHLKTTGHLRLIDGKLQART